MKAYAIKIVNMFGGTLPSQLNKFLQFNSEGFEYVHFEDQATIFYTEVSANNYLKDESNCWLNLYDYIDADELHNFEDYIINKDKEYRGYEEGNQIFDFSVIEIKIKDTPLNKKKRKITEYFDLQCKNNNINCKLLFDKEYNKINKSIEGYASGDWLVGITDKGLSRPFKIIQDTIIHELAHIKDISKQENSHNKNWWSIYKQMGGKCNDEVFKEFNEKNSCSSSLIKEQLK